MEGLSDKSDNESDMADHEDGEADKVARQKRGGVRYVHPGVRAATNGLCTYGSVQLPRSAYRSETAGQSGKKWEYL